MELNRLAAARVPSSFFLPHPFPISNHDLRNLPVSLPLVYSRFPFFLRFISLFTQAGPKFDVIPPK